MKSGGWAVALAIVGSLLAAGILLFLSRPMQGTPIVLKPPDSTETASPLIVHVTGAVEDPGVYAMPPGSRIQDVILAAGGLLRGADSEHLNLAARIVDGQYLEVPFLVIDLIMPSAEPAEPATIPNRSFDLKLDGPVDINTANLEELDTLPGVGPAIAERIIEYRQTIGLFQTIEDIQKVKGIGPQKFEDIQDLITVKGQ